MVADIGFTGGYAGYGMMYHAEKADNDVMVDEIVAAVEERADVLAAEVAE